MSWIKEIEEEDAEGKLGELYDGLKKQRGKISNIMKVHSLNPNALAAHLDLYMSIMFRDRKISREECELIAVIVSASNGCKYCVEHHSEALNHYWKDNQRIDELIMKQHEMPSLTEREKSLVRYARKLTENPNSIENKDIEEFRDNGLSESEILNVNLITSYFNFVNRIALGLGVEVTKEEKEGYNY